MKFSIKKIFGGGFFLLVFIIVTLSVFSYQGISKVGEALSTVTMIDQPLATQAMLVSTEIGSLTTKLGYLLISPSAAGKQSVEEGIKRLDQAFTKLKELCPQDEPHMFSSALQDIELIKKQTLELGSLLDEILQLVDQPERNFPAQQYYNLNMASGAVSINQLYADSLEILSELEEDESDSELFTKISFNINKQFNQFTQLDNALLLYLSYRDDSYLSDVRMYSDELARDITPLIALIEEVDEDIVDNLSEVNTTFMLFKSQIETLIALHKNDDWRRDSYLVTTSLRPLTNSLAAKLDGLVATLNKQTVDRSKLAESTQVSVLKSIVVITVLSLILSIAVIFLVNHSFRKLDATLHYAFEVLAQGDLTQHIADDRIEEVNHLSKSFNNHTCSLNESLREVQNVVYQVQDISSQLKCSSMQTDKVISGQLKDSDIAEGNITQLAGFSDRVAQCSIKSSDTAQAAKEFAFQGLKEVSQLSGEIEMLVSSLDRSEREMESLVAQSNSIDAITCVISEISEKTNLLSLNAAIEAARAGEHGRGFAVVADEVRALSTNTHSETEKIVSIIKGLVLSVEESKQSMHVNNEQVKGCARTVQATVETFNSIVGDVNAIVEHSENIRQMAEQQCKSSTAAKACIVKVVQGSHCSEESSSDVKEASIQLEAASRQLAKHMCKFTL